MTVRKASVAPADTSKISYQEEPKPKPYLADPRTNPSTEVFVSGFSTFS